MIRIALYDANAEEARNMRRVLGSFAQCRGVPNVSIEIACSYSGFLEILEQMEPGYFQVALIRVSASGDTVLEKLSNLLSVMTKATPSTKAIVLSDNPNHAFNAYEVGASFLHTPFDEQGFSNTIGKSLLHAVAVSKRPFPVKSGKTVLVMNLHDIMFAETGKRGPVIHLPQDKLVPVQGTLQALYDRLHALDEQFLRAGGSFIVNVDNIRSTSGDTVIFSNGEAIILPTRSRKTVLDAFESWKLRTAQ